MELRSVEIAMTWDEKRQGQKQLITLPIHMTDLNTERFLTHRIRASLGHSDSRHIHCTWLVICRSTLSQFLLLWGFSHNIPAAFNASKFLWLQLWVSISSTATSTPRRTHQKDSMSLKPNRSGVLPGVLDSERFNFHSEVSILRCMALSEFVCGIREKQKCYFQQKSNRFLAERVTKRARSPPGLDLNR